MSAPTRVLVIDDEPAIRESLAFALGRDGFEVLAAGSLQGARAAWERADLLILDLMLPDGSGVDFLRWLRQHSRVPVLILSSRGDETDRVVGLELGADDYVVKPFSPREVVARVRAVLRRTAPQEPSAAPLGGPGRRDATLHGPGGLVLDRERRMAWIAATQLELTKLQFDLLAELLRAPGRVRSREALLDRVWCGTCVSDRTVDVHIKELRRRVEAAGGDAGLIETVRGVGYRLREA